MSTQKTKAIIIGPAFPLRGGIANFNEALCRAMQEEGYDVEIISFSLQYPSFLFPGTTQFESGKGPADIRILPEINSINPFSWYKTGAYIRKAKPDILIVRYWLPFMAPALGTIIKRARKDKNIKVIAITDNIIPHEKRPGDSILTRYFINQCQGFIAMSHSVLNDLKKFSSTDKTMFLPHPLYTIFGKKANREDALNKLRLPDTGIVLFFGFIRKYKGLDILIEAMGDERLKKLPVKLLVAGEYYEDSKPYTDLIREKGLSEKIILHTHYIKSDDVKYYFAACDIVAQPYRTATQSGVTQIAYHFEKPMLVTDVGGLAEIVPDNKVGYVTEVDPKSVAEALWDFFQNKRSEEFLENLKIEKKKFDWTYFVDGIKRLSGRL